DTYVLDMDLPGLTEKDVDLSLKDNVLTISSTQEEKKENKKNSEWIVHERTSSSFSRSFTLPDDVEGSKISASFKNGVLTITMPRNKALTESKKIAITAA
ncbi:MAG: Hsp20/alpha crystallin family protein, partial [Treponema sp.]|nr:Hsp20/alpha crystallin family protein [Treponema sp.]